MKIFGELLINYIPKVVSVSLWIGYFLYDVNIWVAVTVTGYSLTLSVFDIYQKKKSFDGVIELTETDEGSKKFQLIVNKDPESFQDQDKVVFLFKGVS